MLVVSGRALDVVADTGGVSCFGRLLNHGSRGLLLSDEAVDSPELALDFGSGAVAVDDAGFFEDSSSPYFGLSRSGFG